MPSFFSKLKGKDGPTKASKKKGGFDDSTNEPPKPQWTDAWTRKNVEPEEIHDLVRGCTVELKSRALDTPFLLLPFRPTSDPSAARTFIRNFFDRGQLRGEALKQELLLTEPMVLCSVLKWCWSRLAGGVVSWDAYELFKVGEHDSNYARDAFATFIPLSVDHDARKDIIFDYFDLLAAIAAHGKTNGLAGRKLSRYAGWWAFDHVDTGNGFEGGYKGWSTAADAASHLFFAYLRSLSPDSVSGINGVSQLPTSLQKLVQETEYPPEKPSLLQQSTTKVVMIVDKVSPTPFSLLRRANHFQYRDDDRALQQFSEYEDPVKALTDECRRVLRSISSTNQSQTSNSKDSTGLRDASWSRFEDIGFSANFDDADDDSFLGSRKKQPQGLRTTPMSGTGRPGDRPTTPSWADFLSSGFVDESQSNPAPLLLPPDKILPPIDTNRGKSSQSHRPRLESTANLEPGELASITRFDLDDSFWWVWISSLAGEETLERKAAFGRCALIETIIPRGRWLLMEEMVRGAAPEPEAGAYIAEKKSFWGRTKKNKNSARRKSDGKSSMEKPSSLRPGPGYSTAGSKTSIGLDQHARIQAAAIQLQQRQREQDAAKNLTARRGRGDLQAMTAKTASVFTLQPVIMNEASSAMKWANRYDKDAIREAYLANNHTGRGLGQSTMQSNGMPYASQTALSPGLNSDRELPATPSPLSQSPITPAPLPPIPGPQDQEKADAAAAIALPGEQGVHPLQRKPVPSSPVAPNASEETPRLSGEQSSSPESKKQKPQKLKKKDPATAGGFRKLFGRNKAKAPKAPPPNASEAAMNGKNGGLKPEGNSLSKKFSRKKSPLASPASPDSESGEDGVSPGPPASSGERTPVTPQHEQSLAPSVQDDVSRVDTIDAQEAHNEFSKFDQGPLDDVPAFVPDSPSRASFVPDSPRESEISPIMKDRFDTTSPLEHQVSPQDKWAQIRQNAKDKAAKRDRASEEQSRGGQSVPTDDGDADTSGEETIESRVARIKARVAELTGNMDNGNAAPPPLKQR